MRHAVAIAMMLEGVATAARFARFISLLAIYPPLVVLLLVCRAGIGAALLSGGLMLLQRRPAGPALARVALLTSAAFGTFEIGFALVPTSIFPAYRWAAVATYWVYAVGAAWWIGRLDQE